MECRAGTIYLSVSLNWMAGLYIFFLFSGSVVAGMVRLKWWTGVLFFIFFYFVVSSFWRLDVCGRISVLYNLIYFCRIVVFLAVPIFSSW